MTLKKLNMVINYKFASEIINLFSSASIDDDFGALTFVSYSSPEEFILDVFENGINCMKRPEKYSLLHHFIEGYLCRYLSYKRYYLFDSLCDDLEKERLLDFFRSQYELISEYQYNNFNYEEVIDTLNVAFENSDYENDKEYKEGLEALYDKYVEEFEPFIPKIVDSIFFLLFGNKKFLFNFNNYMSSFVSKQYLPNDMFNEYNHIIRANFLPEWLKRAVYYRDRGRCQYCNRDISGLFSILEDKEKHFDHIIPLEKGGTNDATNFQLTCSECNLSKNKNLVAPEHYYEVYW
jgi:hypothetical protein